MPDQPRKADRSAPQALAEKQKQKQKQKKKKKKKKKKKRNLYRQGLP